MLRRWGTARRARFRRRCCGRSGVRRWLCGESRATRHTSLATECVGLNLYTLPVPASSRVNPLPQISRRLRNLCSTCGSGFTREEAGTASRDLEQGPPMNHRTALGALHIGALFFGLTGVFGKLAASASPAIIVFGRAAFAVLALALFASLAGPGWQRL
ncbi:protein of unknown function, partial [Pseudomonas sp. JV551A1]